MKSEFKGPYRSKTFDGAPGSYVLVYQRPGETALLDLCFFDGDREVADATSMLLALEVAIGCAKNWNAS